LHAHPLAYHRNGKKYLHLFEATLAKLKGITMKKMFIVLNHIL